MKRMWTASLLALALLVMRPAIGAADAAQRYVEVRGAKLYVETVGRGPPILFLHGGATSFGQAFEQQRAVFAATRTVIGIDQRGHGHSPDGPWDLSYKLMADDTAAVLESLGLAAVDVVGHSDGANTALILARDHPRLVRRVVVSGANLRSGLTAEQAAERRNSTPEQLAAKLEEVAGRIPPAFRAVYARVSPDGPDRWMTLLRKCYFMWLEPVVIDAADLGKIEAPVLVMRGDQDFTSIEETVEIYRGLRKSQLLVLPGTGHGTFSQRPRLVNLAISEFLDDRGEAPRKN